ncbi:MAG TPA: hypothetical protein VK607_17385 [Kofleriaceae bacterium]|nr:hypothetical protein [Kofleriaceae bacterium]
MVASRKDARMDRRLAWLLVPLLAAAALWWGIHRRSEASGSQAASAAPVAAERAAATQSSGAAAGHAEQPGAANPSASPPSGSAASPAAAATAPGAPPVAPRPDRAADPVRTGEPARTDSTPQRGSDDDAPAGKFTDRTGWGDASVGKQLNKEFMPLASECIDQAKARKPRLQGMLAFTMVLAPTGDGKTIVSSVKAMANNQIDDPELFECIRESSFALEGLKAPHDFTITMPIQPEGSGT